MALNQPRRATHNSCGAELAGVDQLVDTFETPATLHALLDDNAETRR